MIFIFHRSVPLYERANFIIYILSRLSVNLGQSVFMFAVTYFIMYETGSALYFSINLVISMVVSFIVLPFSGYLSDFKNKKRIILYGEGIQVLLILSFFGLVTFSGVNLFVIYTYTFLSSLVSPFISNAFQSAIVELFDKSRIQKVTGYTASILSSVIIGGPILAGILFGLLEFNQMILLF
ncbi:MFS transporter [Corticicoccus populi]|uniref:MFS transporter n=1 Tax=Corticicoccus populi TaxID=1812821 RepID=A0ABW5WUU1_9STAP